MICVHEQRYIVINQFAAQYISFKKRFVIFVFLPRDASAERGNATVSRPSVCLSVRLSVCDV